MCIAMTQEQEGEKMKGGRRQEEGKSDERQDRRIQFLSGY